jgi:hypothetical protein
MTEENRRVLEWIAQLMKPNTRETALLELSKKREQVPELALILWHSFGEFASYVLSSISLMASRCHGFPPPRDHFGLPAPQSLPADSGRFEPRLQCARTSSVCSIAHRDAWTLFEWYGIQFD